MSIRVSKQSVENGFVSLDLLEVLIAISVGGKRRVQDGRVRSRVLTHQSNQ